MYCRPTVTQFPLWIAACAIFLALWPLNADPIFPNSVVSNDIDFIRVDDPSILFEVEKLGRARKEMPDKRNDTLFVDDVFTFSLNYKDGSTVSVWVAPTLELQQAGRYIKHVGRALGTLPKPFRSNLSHVCVHDGDETAFAEEGGRFFVLYSKNIEKRLATHDIEETVFHETVHATLEADHARNPEWVKAQRDDPGFVTEYAARHPEKEDLPESALFAYTITKYPGRLPTEIERAVRETMPNRLKYLSKLFQSFEAEHKKGELGGADQPATAPESKLEGDKKLKPESEGRPPVAGG